MFSQEVCENYAHTARMSMWLISKLQVHTLHMRNVMVSSIIQPWLSFQTLNTHLITRSVCIQAHCAPFVIQFISKNKYLQCTRFTVQLIDKSTRPRHRVQKARFWGTKIELISSTKIAQSCQNSSSNTGSHWYPSRACLSREQEQARRVSQIDPFANFFTGEILFVGMISESAYWVHLVAGGIGYLRALCTYKYVTYFPNFKYTHLHKKYVTVMIHHSTVTYFIL